MSVKFTGKTKAKQMSRLINDKKDLYTAWYPMVEIDDGSMVYITDDSTSSGLVECETRYKAIKKAKLFLEEKRVV